MSRTIPLAALAGLAAVGIALVGVGARANFTASTTSSQTITAGHMDVAVSAANVPGCTDATNDCHALTLPAVGPVGSTFETPATHVTITNNGSVTAKFDAIQMTETDNSSAASTALYHQMNVCIRSHDDSGTWVEGNGALTTAVALTPSVKQNGVELAPHATASYWVSFYAGENSAECGTTTSDGTNTRAAWEGYQGGVYHTPASLTDASQGGAVTPTLTFSFTG
jgi:predicted ribosomally synthesized peptide with SipW-like signal peptide